MVASPPQDPRLGNRRRQKVIQMMMQRAQQAAPFSMRSVPGGQRVAGLMARSLAPSLTMGRRIPAEVLARLGVQGSPGPFERSPRFGMPVPPPVATPPPAQVQDPTITSGDPGLITGGGGIFGPAPTISPTQTGTISPDMTSGGGLLPPPPSITGPSGDPFGQQQVPWDQFNPAGALARRLLRIRAS